MGAIVKYISVILAVMDFGDRLGINTSLVASIRAKAKNEGRDVTFAEVQSIAEEAQSAQALVQAKIDHLPE